MYYSVKPLGVSFLQCASHFFQPYRGADAQCSPTESWPAVPRGIELRTRQKSTELSYRGTEKLPTENQCWKYAGRRWGGLLQCQHSIRLLKVMWSCLLVCKFPPQEAWRGQRRLHSECHGRDSGISAAVEHPRHTPTETLLPVAPRI